MATYKGTDATLVVDGITFDTCSFVTAWKELSESLVAAKGTFQIGEVAEEEEEEYTEDEESEEEEEEWNDDDDSSNDETEDPSPSPIDTYNGFRSDHPADEGFLFLNRDFKYETRPAVAPIDCIMPLNDYGFPQHYPGCIVLTSRADYTPSMDQFVQLRWDADNEAWRTNNFMPALTQYAHNYFRRYAYYTRFVTEILRHQDCPAYNIDLQNVGAHSFMEFYILESMAALPPTDEFNPRVSKFLADLAEQRAYFNRTFALALRDYIFVIAAGEARHSSTAATGLKGSRGIPEMDSVLGSDRLTAYHKIITDFAPSPANFDVLNKLFTEVRWSSSFGGNSWGSIVKLGAQYERIAPAVFIDSAAGIQHNGGLAFDKIQATDALGFRIDTTSRASLYRLFEAVKRASNLVTRDLDPFLDREIEDYLHTANNTIGLLLTSPGTVSLARRYCNLMAAEEPQWLKFHRECSPLYHEATGIRGGEIAYESRLGSGRMSLPPELDPNSPYTYCPNCGKNVLRADLQSYTVFSDLGSSTHQRQLCLRCLNDLTYCADCTCYSAGGYCLNEACTASLIDTAIVPSTPMLIPVLQALFPSANWAFSGDTGKWKHYRYPYTTRATLIGDLKNRDKDGIWHNGMVTIELSSTADRSWRVKVMGASPGGWNSYYLRVPDGGSYSICSTLPEAIEDIGARLLQAKFSLSPEASALARLYWKRATGAPWPDTKKFPGEHSAEEAVVPKPKRTLDGVPVTVTNNEE